MMIFTAESMKACVTRWGNAVGLGSKQEMVHVNAASHAVGLGAKPEESESWNYICRRINAMRI
jgi:hypothetical protein